jgi:cation transport regulator ChaC
MAQKLEWKNLFADRDADAAFIKAYNELRETFAQHLVSTGRVSAPQPGFKVTLTLGKFGKAERVIGWAYTALPKEKEETQAARLQRELEEARKELERLRAAQPRLVKAKA